MNNLCLGKTIELMTRPGSNDTSAIISLITVSLSAPLSLWVVPGPTLDISIICQPGLGRSQAAGVTLKLEGKTPIFFLMYVMLVGRIMNPT